MTKTKVRKETKKAKKNLCRVIIDLGFVVDPNDKKMVEKAKNDFYEEVTQRHMYAELDAIISIVEDPKAKKINMPVFETEETEETESEE